MPLTSVPQLPRQTQPSWPFMMVSVAMLIMEVARAAKAALRSATIFSSCAMQFREHIQECAPGHCPQSRVDEFITKQRPKEHPVEEDLPKVRSTRPQQLREGVGLH